MTLRTLPLIWPGTAGSDVGQRSNGMLIGDVALADPDTFLLRNRAQAMGGAIAYDDSASSYTDETTASNEATANDMTLLPAVPAVNDAYYFGHATLTFDQLDINISTQGAGTWTITWEYWDGSAYTALAGVTDGTTGFTATTGVKVVTYTMPTDWAKNTVDGTLCYWIRARVSAYTSVTTQPLATQAWAVTTEAQATYTDDTTDFTDAGTGDVDLLPAHPILTDGCFVGHATKFDQIEWVTSQARTGTATISFTYWNGTSWAALTNVDDSAGWSTTAGTLHTHFRAPADWVANTAANGPNAQTGFFVRCALSALTDVTAQPQATRGYVRPITTAVSGIYIPDGTSSFTFTRLEAVASTVSGTTQDSIFVITNATTGTSIQFTWTKATQFHSEAISFSVAAGNEITMKQIQEDGTTELAGVVVTLLA